VTDRRDDLPGSVKHRYEHGSHRLVHCHVLHGAVAAYEEDDVEPIRIDVLNTHRRCQRGAQAPHIVLLLGDFARVIVVVAQIEAQRVNCRRYAAGTRHRDRESGVREFAVRSHKFFGPKTRRMRCGVFHRPHTRTRNDHYY
jgi:hypothetical protein